ncbi:response regulator transcription factor [Beijerinckia indica]|uniref:Two component transcriptional regulator, LuxR family n=1 Tax=Beijerinckia indica subsp. indica (strain ATCC 9039 / DSM 1715 / NCIMB 8712) TaxID=395963 RepID=B2IDA1_BEII9|nr:response regulator transcription factor [Beijerinckia indica]ACB93958.1 two component transcriptional regulator, LuxR family [Beijerinckia indica subsp. indica ATCC 9039]
MESLKAHQKPVTILIIEDHPIVREGCRRLFSRRPDIETHDAASAGAGLACNKTLRPDVIILDVDLPDASGLDMIPALLQDNDTARIIVFSMYEARNFVTRALELGARGYVTKNDDPDMILQATDKVLSGALYLGQTVAQNLALAQIEPAQDPLRDLSEREREVLHFMGEGKSLGEIARALSLGYKTVANIVSMLKQKLGVTTSPALIKFAVECRSHENRSNENRVKPGF